MEIIRGKAAGVQKQEEQKFMACNVNGCNVLLHPDLERAVEEGEDLIIVGTKNDDGSLRALAIHNVAKNKTRQIDASNYVLGIGAGIFSTMVGLIWAIQYQLAGDSSLALINLVFMLSGTALMLWASIRTLTIKQAASRASVSARAQTSTVSE